MSKKQKLKNAVDELSKINIDEKNYKFWKKTFKVYLDDNCEYLMNDMIAYLLKEHGLKSESKP